VSSEIDVLVIGAGVVGLAAAAQLADTGYSVVVAERQPRPGMETSTHNSGVIHAGLYYPPNSLKATLCVAGADLLLRYCREHRVPADRCGKLIVATSADDVDALETIRARGTANGVAGLEIVDRDFIRQHEPHVEGCAALWSPATGRVDASALVRALQREAEHYGAIVLGHSAVIGGETRTGEFDIRLERETLSARIVVNAAGLHADQVSASLGGSAFTIYPCRGEYAALKPSRRHLVNGLVYPLPHPSGHGLGVHLTRATDGSVLLGPSIRYQTSRHDYENDRLPLEAFVDAARPMLPELSLDDVKYGGSGIRAKLHPPEESFADFLIQRDPLQPRLIQAAGIDSPGLTSCLAIGRMIKGLVSEMLD
jgi:L-2-hydroxyglutarate oxidase LhgO